MNYYNVIKQDDSQTNDVILHHHVIHNDNKMKHITG